MNDINGYFNDKMRGNYNNHDFGTVEKEKGSVN